MDDEKGVMKYLGRMSLFALVASAVIGSVIFIAVYGFMYRPESELTGIAGQALVNGAVAIIGAVVVLMKVRNGNGA